jgi:hypothetical protein
VTGAARALLALATASVALAAGAAPASATFHLVSIREVYPGSSAVPDAEYVELQAYAEGQNRVGGHTLALFAANGAPSGSAVFGADAASSASQATFLVATPAAEARFGVAADTGMPPGSLDPAGGAVCWEALDCVSWGSFSGSTPSPAGAPADPLGIADGMALRRTIAPGCPTLLEPGDDSNSSAADFSDAFPAPRPNSVPPPEHACAPQDGAAAGPGGGRGGSGGARGARGRPRPRLTRGPRRVIHRRSASFRFRSSVPGSTFLCGLDRRRYRPCHSPLAARRLHRGRHVFRVKARAPGGAVDRTPAVWRFRVAPRRGG